MNEISKISDGDAVPLETTDSVMPAVSSTAGFYSKKEMLARIGNIAYPTIWAAMRRGDFPLARELFCSGGKAYWDRVEVETWIATRPVRRVKPVP